MKPLPSAELHRLIRHASNHGFRSIHARRRMEERQFDFNDLTHCLRTGRHNPFLDEFKNGTWRYRVEGRNIDGRAIDLVVAIANTIIIVTVINPNR